MRKAVSIVWVALAAFLAMMTPIFFFNADSGRVLFIVMPLLLVAVFVVLEGFYLRNDYMAKWSKAHGVAITDENRSVLLTYLRRARAIRGSGAFLGYATYVIWIGVTERSDGGAGWIGATFGGYLLGAAAAEFWAFRSESGSPRTASLVPRQITNYVSRRAVFLMRFTPAAIVALAAAWQFIPRGHPTFRGERIPLRPDISESIIWLGLSVVVAVLVEATARRIVRRPQPAVSESFLDADDAIRSTSMHGVVGAGLALQLGILSNQSGQWLRFTSGGDWHAVLSIVSVVSGIAAIFAWLHLGIDQKWVVRRTRHAQEVAA